jgi:hypothetical protein
MRVMLRAAHQPKRVTCNVASRNHPRWASLVKDVPMGIVAIAVNGISILNP